MKKPIRIVYELFMKTRKILQIGNCHSVSFHETDYIRFPMICLVESIPEEIEIYHATLIEIYCVEPDNFRAMLMGKRIFILQN